MPDNIPEWIGGFEHASLATTESKEAFARYAKNYETEGDAIVAGHQHKKLVGAPYKLPESMDKLPDDNVRSEFTSGVHKLLNIRKAGHIDELKDVNLSDGMAKDAPFNDELANAYKQFVVENKLNTSDMPKYSKFFNEMMVKVGDANEAKREADGLAVAEKCEATLIADPDFGSKEKVEEQTELLTRTVKTKLGLTADEVEEFGDALTGELTKNPVMAKAMLKLLAPMAEESQSEGGGGGGGGGGEHEQTPYEYKKLRWPKTETMWGKPDDKWEDEPPETRKRAGRKE